MAGWAGRRRLPDDVRELVPLVPGERVLAWAVEAGGWPVVATDRALVLPEDGHLRRIGWERVEKASWDQESESLAVVASAAPGEATPRWRILLPAAGQLADVIREQVNTTVVLVRRVAMQDGRGALISARRLPGTDDMRWTVAVNRGVDRDDPEFAQWVEEQLGVCKAELGR